MGTRSTISVELNDGSIKKIYCHWNGYLSHNGEILLEHYNSQELAEELVSHGDLSSLDEFINPDPSKPHSFDNRQDLVNVYCGRDRGETGVDAKIYDDLEDYLDRCYWEEYNYLFKDGKWHLIEIYGYDDETENYAISKKLLDLKEEVEADKEDE